jgi:hypothetical protein
MYRECIAINFNFRPLICVRYWIPQAIECVSKYLEFKAGWAPDSCCKFSKATLLGIMKDELWVTLEKQLTYMFTWRMSIREDFCSPAPPTQHRLILLCVSIVEVYIITVTEHIKGNKANLHYNRSVLSVITQPGRKRILIHSQEWFLNNKLGTEHHKGNNIFA